MFKPLVIALSLVWSSAAPAGSLQQTLFQSHSHALPTSPQNLQDIPEDILKEIKAAPTVDIYNVTGDEQFNGKILKANQIVFDSDARLVLTDTKDPFVVIIAKQIKFRAPDHRSIISTDLGFAGSKGDDGSLGGAGQTGNNAPNKNNGGPGGMGGTGVPGGVGETPHLPALYFMTDEMLEQASSRPPFFIDLGFIFPGPDGGDGGRGGDGGTGGNGGSGGRGVDYLFGCAGGPGDGGRGGNGGIGGQGGDAGSGGDGAEIFYVAPQSAMQLISYSKVINIGGGAGRSGQGGRPGDPGTGGPRGGRTTYCTGGSAGPDGAYPTPSSLGPGNAGKAGNKGHTTSIVVDSVDSLF